MLSVIITAPDISFEWRGCLKFIPREGEEISIENIDGNYTYLLVEMVELMIALSGNHYAEIRCKKHTEGGNE